MRILSLAALAVLACLATAPTMADDTPAADHPAAKDKDSAPAALPPMPKDEISHGSVTVDGRHVDYKAIAGILAVTDKDRDEEADQKDAPVARMFYVAYMKDSGKDGDTSKRPVTFIYNGGPGSSTLWLHMGALGPKRVVTADNSHTRPAPYQIVSNDYSLLDASDLVFIDAPGTGFGRLYGKDNKKTFNGVDQDGKAFARFIVQFLNRYSRWNSPKYLFGESYGTTRSAVLANLLETQNNVDLNGVILLSAVLNFADGPDEPEASPGLDQPYEFALPTYAATAWYHHRLEPQPAELQPFLKEVETFALGDYAAALAAGDLLDPARKAAVAEQMHRYIGLPTAYILKADLRITGGEFEKTLLEDQGLTVGRFDTRFTGATMDPLSESADYDPQSSAISSAYVAAFNNYVRTDLHFGGDEIYRSEIDVGDWDIKHQPPGAPMALPQTPDVIPDLAAAMKVNPHLRVLLNAGYYDLATPYFAALFELHHLGLPPPLQKNLSYGFYESGHMVYAHPESLKQLHDNAATFIERGSGS